MKRNILLVLSLMAMILSCGSDDEDKKEDDYTYPVKYTVFFDANGGVITTTKEEVTTASEDSLKELYSPEELGLRYDGHVFYGWNTQADGKGPHFSRGVGVWEIFRAIEKEEKGATVTLYALWINPNETVATANVDGSYSVTPYNFEPTLKSLSEKGVTEAKFRVSEVVNENSSDNSFEKNFLNTLNVALKKYESVSVALDLSESWLTYFSGYEKVRWDSGVNYENGGFYECKNLKEIVLPEGLVRLGKKAFYGCENISSITLPSTLKKVEREAFMKDSSTRLNLKTVIFTGTLENWLKIDFDDSYFNSYPISSSSSFIIDGKELKEVVVPDSITEIKHRAFECIQSIEKVTIPNTVTSIGRYAFDGCRNLKEIELPDSIKSINNGAFCGTYALQSIIIPSQVTFIGSETFYNSGIKSIVFAGDVTDIYCSAFYNCENLSFVTFKDTTTNWYHWSNKNKTQTSIGTMSDPSSNAQKLLAYSKDKYNQPVQYDNLYTAKSKYYKAE